MTVQQRYVSICEIANYCYNYEDLPYDIAILFELCTKKRYIITKDRLKIANKFYKDLKKNLDNFFPKIHTDVTYYPIARDFLIKLNLIKEK